MNDLIIKLENCYCKYQNTISEIESRLKNKVKFNFSIQHLAGDGHCILNNKTTSVAPVDLCLKIIKEKGKLTRKDHKNISI